MDERQRGLVARVLQVAVIGRELTDQNHALVDDGAGRHRDGVVFRDFLAADGKDAVGDDLAYDEEPALKFILVGEAGRAADEDLLRDRLNRLHAFAESRIVDRHVAPAEHGLAFGGDDLLDDLAHLAARRGVARHEELADRVMAGPRQAESELGAFRREKPVRDLGQNSAAIAERRIGPDGATMVEIDQDLQTLLEDVVRLVVLQMRHEANTAGVMLLGGVVEAVGARHQGVRANRRPRCRCRLSPVGGPLGSSVHLSASPHSRYPEATAFQIFEGVSWT